MAHVQDLIAEPFYLTRYPLHISQRHLATQVKIVLTVVLFVFDSLFSP